MSWVAMTMYKMHSSRCPRKNHREFYDGKSLVDIKIEQFLNCGAEHVYVSTNDPDVEDTDRVTYIQRPEHLCDDSYEGVMANPWPVVMKHIYHSLPVSDDTVIIYSNVVVPLFHRYDEMYERYLETGNNQLVVHPVKHHCLNHDKLGVNFMAGHYHARSQELHPVYQVPWGGTLATLKDIKAVDGYPIPRDFEYFPVSMTEHIDIDTEEEYELCQAIYKQKISK
mgnify:CR=1 FL=1